MDLNPEGSQSGDNRSMTFEWALPNSLRVDAVQSLTEAGAKLDSHEAFFVPPEDEAADYGSAAYEPMTLISGAIALGLLLEKVSAAVRGLRHGGCILDIRTDNLKIRSNPSVPVDTVLVIGAGDVRSVQSPSSDSLGAAMTALSISQ